MKILWSAIHYSFNLFNCGRSVFIGWYMSFYYGWSLNFRQWLQSWSWRRFDVNSLSIEWIDFQKCDTKKMPQNGFRPTKISMSVHRLYLLNCWRSVFQRRCSVFDSRNVGFFYGWSLNFRQWLQSWSRRRLNVDGYWLNVRSRLRFNMNSLQMEIKNNGKFQNLENCGKYNSNLFDCGWSVFQRRSSVFNSWNVMFFYGWSLNFWQWLQSWGRRRFHIHRHWLNVRSFDMCWCFNRCDHTGCQKQLGSWWQSYEFFIISTNFEHGIHSILWFTIFGERNSNCIFIMGDRTGSRVHLALAYGRTSTSPNEAHN